jgi:predicted methyltransferase
MRMRTLPLLTAAVALALAASACHRDARPDEPAPTAESVAETAPEPAGIVADIASVQAGDWREAKNVARDRYRHPAQTLEFFGIAPSMTVIEIWPGGGWYTEILGPYLRDRGHYVAAINDPAKATTDKSRDSWQASSDKLRAKVLARPDAYGSPVFLAFDPQAPELGAPETVDAVLTFRNVHNWVMQGTEADMFEAFYEVLKPGGVLGVVDHRARAGAPADEIKN